MSPSINNNKREKSVTTSYLLNCYSSSGLCTKLSLIRKSGPALASKQYTIPVLKEVYNKTARQGL